MSQVTISESAVALDDIDRALTTLNREKRELETKIACLEMVRSFLLTEIRDVSNLLLKGQNHASQVY